jgi:hypothetical protein
MRMNKIVFSTYGHSPALLHARNYLKDWGYAVSDMRATATHLLLPVPSFDEDGNVKGSGPLPELQEGLVLMGGNLQGYTGRKVDFLQDPYYLGENAATPARCAQKSAPVKAGTRVLVIGWGRIGKMLCPLLAELGAEVTAAVRKESSFREAEEGGFRAIFMQDLKPRQFDVVYNTAPASVLFSGECREDAVLVDLSSYEGIFGKGVIRARGLPGKDAPEESGALIAKTALRYALGKEHF